MAEHEKGTNDGDLLDGAKNAFEKLRAQASAAGAKTKEEVEEAVKGLEEQLRKLRERLRK